MELSAKGKKYCEALGSKIKELRQDAGLTQEKLAELTQVHFSYIGKIERGELVPSLKLLIEIAEKLDVPLNYLLQAEKSSQLKKSVSDLIALIKDLPEEDIKFLKNAGKLLLKKIR